MTTYYQMNNDDVITAIVVSNTTVSHNNKQLVTEEPACQDYMLKRYSDDKLYNTFANIGDEENPVIVEDNSFYCSLSDIVFTLVLP